MKKHRLFSLVMLCAAALPASAQSPAGAQYFPLVFSAEGTPVQTAACISASIRVTGTESWWRPGAITAGPGPADKALLGVLDAIRREDRKALLAASHRTHGRDQKRFDDQASALFSQFPVLGTASVQYAIAFDEFTVYYLRFGSTGRGPLVPFVFELDEDGAWRYLPYHTESLTYELLRDWARSPIGLGGSGAVRTLCAPGEVAKLRLAIPLGRTAPRGAVRSHLYLNAEALPAAPRAQAAARAFTALQKALVDDNPEAYAAGLTPNGRKRFLAWHASASETEQQAPRYAVEGMRPVLAFDLAPLTVLVLRGSGGGTELVYFLTGTEPPLMVNSAYISTVDRVFKGRNGPVRPVLEADKVPLKRWVREP